MTNITSIIENNHRWLINVQAHDTNEPTIPAKVFYTSISSTSRKKETTGWMDIKYL